MTKSTRNLLQSPDNFKSIGEYLTYIREVRGYTLRDVEDVVKTSIKNSILEPECSLSHGYLANIESGKSSKPSPYKLKALAHVYRIPHEMLMQKAGYWETSEDKLWKDASFTLMLKEVHNMSPSEMRSVLDYIDFVKSRRKHDKSTTKG